MSRFPAAFRPPAFASRSPCSRPGAGPSSRSAYRAPPGARTRTGFPRFTPARYDRGGCPLYPRDDGAPPGRMPCPAGACRFPAASPCHPATHPTSGAPKLRGINGGSRDSPVRSAPHLWPPGWDGRPLGLSLCSAPRRYRRRTTGRGRAVSTRPELRDRHSRSSNPRVPSHSATSCRNGRTGRSRQEWRCIKYGLADRLSGANHAEAVDNRAPTRRSGRSGRSTEPIRRPPLTDDLVP
jgi:hypothetical protein